MRALAFTLALLLPALAISATKKATKNTAPVRKAAVRKTSSTTRRAPVRAPRYVITEAMRTSAADFVAQAMQPRDSGIEQPAALVPFFEHLYQASKGRHAVRVLHFGDSHTASDDWANTLRTSFQARFGNGGPGFVHAGRPYAGYRRWDTESSASGQWITVGLLGDVGDGVHGLSGLSISAIQANARITLGTDAKRVELLFLQQPQGGDMQVSVTRPGEPGVRAEAITTKGDVAPAVYQFPEGQGQRDYSVTTYGNGWVRLFGWIAENDSGVSWEMLGINGASATLQSVWDNSLSEAHIAKRSPALIVLAYGTNEAVSSRFDPVAYEASLTSVIARCRRAAPQAAILIVGPDDAARRTRYGVTPLPSLDAVIAVQQSVARKYGCAYWNWREHMGGAGAMKHWVMSGYAQGDYIHLTKAGYELTGRTLFEELMLNYEKFLAVRSD